MILFCVLAVYMHCFIFLLIRSKLKIFYKDRTVLFYPLESRDAGFSVYNLTCCAAKLEMFLNTLKYILVRPSTVGLKGASSIYAMVS